MSRLTASPFHKPSPFEFPRAVPLSPPETNSEQIGPSHLSTTVSVAGGFERSTEAHYLESPEAPHLYSHVPEPVSRLRRGPSLTYQSSGLREAKERVVQRSSRSFIIVIPPSILLQEHGQLGHTLSLGPRHRLGQGMLMPLFPTMYGQLSAIAREFNFPSTTGLCLYFHFTDGGIVSTPRISDDSWQMIWSPFLDPSAPSQRSPICGKIEFEIDLRYARWYHAWMASAHREQLDVPVSVAPSTAPSLAHFRSDSRNTFDNNPNDDRYENSSITGAQSTARHIPKKLSLVDRLDTLSTRSFPRGSSRDQIVSPPEQEASPPHLSPIHQEDEPQTAKLDLEKRVNNWRASAVLTPSGLAVKQGQMSLEPANMPNSISLDDVDDNGDDELNLDDFQWSVSSQGPGEYDEELSILSWPRLPSVHLANRLEGSVCLTPTTATSFGPSDYTLPSPAPLSERVFTPDLGQRFLEEVPLTPTTATSWGPPSEYPASPFSASSRVPSVDLGYRLTFSRPVTPTTATSWGPSSWPSSPVESEYYERPRSIHLGERGAFSRPVTPSTATTWGAPLSYPPSPATPFYVTTPDAGHRAFDEDSQLQAMGRPWAHGWPYNGQERGTVEEPETAPWAFGWPYNQGQERPWAHGWPYNQSAFTQSGSLIGIEAREEENAPWAHGWPYHQSEHTESREFSALESGESAIPWAHGWPYHQSEHTEFSEVAVAPWKYNWPYRSTSSQPWRHNWPYNLRKNINEGNVGKGIDICVSAYPYFNLYPAVYPDNLSQIYPRAAKPQAWHDHSSLHYPYNLDHIYSGMTAAPLPPKSVDVKLRPSYPVFDLYPSTYPGNLDCIYPPCSLSDESDSRIVSGYPSFVLYPTVYPYFDLYPAISRKQRGSLDVQTWSRKVASVKKAIDVYVAPSYPAFRLYSAVYPYNLDEIYPPDTIFERVKSVAILSGYPCFDLYPAVYPYFELYPVLPSAVSLKAEQAITARATHSKAGYPDFVLYPPIARTKVKKREASSSNSVVQQSPLKGIKVDSDACYPIITIYRSVYPNLDVYPPLPKDTWVIPANASYPFLNIYPPVGQAKGTEVRRKQPQVKSSTPYPTFTLYEPAYPHLDIYPPVSGQVDSKYVEINVKVQYPEFNLYPAVSHSGPSNLSDERYIMLDVIVHYPVFNLYPSVYPWLDVYPAVAAELDHKYVTNGVTVDYPVFNLYRAVYPHIDLYPAVSDVLDTKLFSVEVVQYPVFNLYPAAYPYIELYPAVSGVLDSKYFSVGVTVHYPVFELYHAVYPYIDVYPSVSGQVEDGKEIVLKVDAQYPSFDLYPAIYPHFCLYPAVQPQIGSLDFRAPRQSLKSRKSRLTHAELHAIVVSQNGDRFTLQDETHAQLHRKASGSMNVERPTNKPIVKARKPMKTHLQLHQEVFPGFKPVHTPSGTYRKSVSFRIEDVQNIVPTNLRPHARVDLNQRTSSPLTTSPSRGLPPRPNHRLSTLESPLVPPPVQGLPPRPSPSRQMSVADPESLNDTPQRQSLRRSASSASPSRLPSFARSANTLSTVDEQVAITPLSRSSSLSHQTRTSSLQAQGAALDRSASTPETSRFTPRKRDSLVAQRIKAYSANNAVEDDVLSKFPMPPRPPIPGIQPRS